MKLQPVGDQVLVQLDPRPDKFGDLLVRPDIAAEKPIWGTVLGTGPGRMTKGSSGQDRWLPVTVSVGDRVCLAWGTGHDIKIGGKHMVFIHEHGPNGDGDGGLLAVEE
jgi:co-chaperonin GroES (HSP10)